MITEIQKINVEYGIEKIDDVLNTEEKIKEFSIKYPKEFWKKHLDVLHIEHIKNTEKMIEERNVKINDRKSYQYFQRNKLREDVKKIEDMKKTSERYLKNFPKETEQWLTVDLLQALKRCSIKTFLRVYYEQLY